MSDNLEFGFEPEDTAGLYDDIPKGEAAKFDGLFAKTASDKEEERIDAEYTFIRMAYNRAKYIKISGTNNQSILDLTDTNAEKLYGEMCTVKTWLNILRSGPNVLSHPSIISFYAKQYGKDMDGWDRIAINHNELRELYSEAKMMFNNVAGELMMLAIAMLKHIIPAISNASSFHMAQLRLDHPEKAEEMEQYNTLF